MSSSATVRVEKATSDLLTGPDWTMNMDICDSVNSNQWQAKDVVKAVKKRLQHKNPRVQFFALTLLETMMMNCGDYVHFQVVEREILPEMVKIVRKKTDMQVRDKILVLLDSWQEAFGGPQGKYPQYHWAYAELRRSGVQFPQRSGDAVPIFTPPVTHPVPRHPPAGYGMPNNSSMRLDEAMASEMRNLSLSDLEAIRRVAELLSDMLQAVNPSDRGAVKDEIIVDLISQCRSNQKKVLHLVSSTMNEELLSQGLELNDNLQYLIAKHDAIASGSPLPIKASESVLRPSVPGPSAPSFPAAVATDRFEVEEEAEDDGFSELARRKSKTKTVPSQSSSADTGDQEASSTLSDVTTATTSSSRTEAASSTSSNALALPDYPAPVRTVSKEQDMIDLLSITLSTNPSPPHTPLTPPSASTENGSFAATSPNAEGHPYNPQPTPPSAYTENGSQAPVYPNAQGYPLYNHQTYPTNRGYMPYNSYVAPWAQQTAAQPMWQPQLQPQQYSSSYPPPPWATSLGYDAGRYPSPAYQHPAPNANTVASYGSPVQASKPLLKYNSFGSGGTTPLASKPLQHQSSFGSRGNVSQGVASETQTNAVRPAGPATASKPFIPSYRLFEDLIDLRNPDGGIKTNGKTNGTSLSGSSSQSMVSGRK